MKQLIPFTFSLIGITQGVIAEVGSGGGKAVVCRDTENQIISATLLDLYEAEVQHGLELRPSSGDILKDYALTAIEMERIKGQKPAPQKDIEDHIERTLRYSFSFVPEDEKLPDLDDVGAVVPKLPDGCQLEQAAVFHFSNNPAFEVALAIWNAMPPLDQAALAMQAIVYRQNKLLAGEETSQSIRRLVGRLFSTKPLPSYKDKLPADWQICRTSGSDTDPLATKFYAFPTAIKKTMLRFVNIIGRETYWPIEIEIDAAIRPDAFVEDRKQGNHRLLVTDPKADYDDVTRIETGPYEGYSIRVVYRFQKPFSVSLQDQAGNDLQDVELTTCSPAPKR